MALLAAVKCLDSTFEQGFSAVSESTEHMIKNSFRKDDGVGELQWEDSPFLQLLHPSAVFKTIIKYWYFP